MPAAGRPDDAAHDGRRRRTVDDGFTHREAVERGPRRDRLLQQDGVELAAADREAALVTRIPCFDRDATFAGDDHPVDRQPPRLDAAGEAEAAKDRERARVDRIAAQLVTRKRRAVEEPHTHAGAGEDGRGHGASGASANDQDVIHEHEP